MKDDNYINLTIRNTNLRDQNSSVFQINYTLRSVLWGIVEIVNQNNYHENIDEIKDKLNEEENNNDNNDDNNNDDNNNDNNNNNNNNELDKFDLPFTFGSSKKKHFIKQEEIKVNTTKRSLEVNVNKLNKRKKHKKRKNILIDIKDNINCKVNINLPIPLNQHGLKYGIPYMDNLYLVEYDLENGLLPVEVLGIKSISPLIVIVRYLGYKEKIELNSNLLVIIIAFVFLLISNYFKYIYL
jgi:hypothetical protein